MKKRVLKIAALLMAAVGFAPQAQADTDLLTQEKGYTKITQMPADEDLDDYYFIIVDKNNDLMVSQENKMWYYKTSVDPATDSKKVWMIERGTAENSYAFRNMAEPTYLIEAPKGSGWDFIVKTSATPNDNTSFICTYTDNNWILESVVNSGEYIGPWNNNSNTMDGERLAANKSETQRGYFVIYSILKTTFDNQELTEAKNKATAEIADYEAILTNSTAESEVSTTYSTAISKAQSDVNGATDTEAVDAAMAALEAERQAYVQNAAPNDGYTFDMTFLIQNAAVTNTDGWTNARTNNGQQYTDAPDNIYFDTYNETRDMFQNITVRPGVYKLTAATRAEATLGTGYIYINDTKADVEKQGNQGNTLGAGWDWTTTAETSIYANAKIGFYSECGGGKWAGADNFKLEFVRPLTDDETLSLAKESLQQKFDETSAMNLETNVGDAAFQIPTSLAQAVRNALLTAETTAEKTDATLKEVDNAIKALDNAVAAFNAPTLNAPAAGDRFNVIINADGGSIDNMAWTCIYNEAASADGWYNLQWAHAADANYAQALIFTPTGEKNQYTISFIDAEGNTRYICTQKAAGYMDGDVVSGRTDRIRVTTDATKALKVNISATDTEGIWHLNNTEHGQNVGANNSNDAGVFTSNNSCNLTLVKAEEAEVNLTVTDAGWATLILPFNAEVPDGLTAYTCSEAEETTTEGEATLVLEEAATLAANTPYIIQGAADDTYDFSGYGLATQDTYGNSFMTGTLVEKAAADQGTYVLQNQDGKVGFYLVGDAQPKVGAYRAYLNAEAAPAGSNVQAFILKGIDGDGTTTGIDGTMAEADATVNVYNLNGILVRQNVKMSEALDGLQKGIYIVNGTKKAVK